MAFFKRKEKQLAKNKSYLELQYGYNSTEKELREAAKTGNIKQLSKAMQKHHDYEYALLYRETPKFKKKTN